MAPRETERESPVNPPRGHYIDLGQEGIRTPRGWSNRSDDLRLDTSFMPDKGVAALVASKGYRDAWPIMTDNDGVYVFRAVKDHKEEFFVWNHISGVLMRATEKELNLQQVVETAGSSLLALDMDIVGST